MGFQFILVDNPPKIDPLSMRESRAVQKYAAFAEDTIVPWLWSKKALKALCIRNDIPIEWVSDWFSRKMRRSVGYPNRRENRKIGSLTLKKFKKVLKELKGLNEQSAVIASILWFLNSNLEEGGGYITLEEILRVKIMDFSPEEEIRPARIDLMRTGRCTHLVSHWLPLKLGKSICRQIKKNSIFIFSNKYGGPLLPEQVKRHLLKVAKSRIKRAGDFTLKTSLQ